MAFLTGPDADTGATSGQADPARAKAAVDLLTRCIERTVASDTANWLRQSVRDLSAGDDESKLVRALGLAPRRLGRADLVLAEDDLSEADALRSGWDIKGLSVDQAARIVLVLASYQGDDPAFAETVEALCRTAEVNELIAYYRGLAIFPAAPLHRDRAREGIRSAITPVFEAVAHRNPFPRAMFDQDAWNQMVLKALFIGSRLDPIQGLDERSNPELASMLVDYAHERWAAGRPVSPELWRCVGPFADERALAALARVLESGRSQEQLAAGLALRACPHRRAREILARHPGCERQLDETAVTWPALMQMEAT
jgi:hypothetical protein